MKKRVLAALMSVLLLWGTVPTAAFAEEAVPSSDPSSVEILQGAEDSQGGSETEDEEEEPSEEVPEEVPEEPEETPEEGMGLALPKTEKPLLDILALDEEGDPQIYTTLYDGDRRVIDTNDPELKQDDYYGKENDRGELGTVGLGAEVYVHFRLASILPNDGENGVQEDVTYVLDNLPDELVPAEKDRDNNQILNPETPVEFFRTAGDLAAYGGIYGREGSYQLKVFFQHVEGSIDISGAFRYGANVSDELTPGKTYELTDIPGGPLSFTVTPQPPEVPESEGYKLSLYGTPIGNTSYWSATIDRCSKETGTNLPYQDMTITYEGSMGVWVDEGAPRQMLNQYGNPGPGLRLFVGYNTKDESGKAISEQFADSYGNVDIIENGDGVTTVRFKSKQQPLQVDVTFKLDDAAADTRTAYQGNNSYITKTVHVKISDGQGGYAKNIARIQLYVPTLNYDDYRTGSHTYTGSAYLNQTAAAASMEATHEINTDLSFNTPALKGSDYPYTYNPYSYEYLPGAIHYTLESNTKSYSGNYYWVEFQPAVENMTGASYYASNRSFLPEKALISKNGEEATFSTEYGGTKLIDAKNKEIDGWEYVGTVSVGDVKTDANLMADSECFAASASDVKLQYQLKQVFAGADDAGQLIVYRGKQDEQNQKYVYLIIDPSTYAAAKASDDNGWHEYMEGDGTSAKPAAWRIHIFNAPNTSFNASLYEYLGAFQADDVQERQKVSFTSRLQTGADSYHAKAAASNDATSTFNKYPASYMEAQWVDNRTIFWTFTFDVRFWPSWDSGVLYANLGNGQSLNYSNGSSSSVNVNGERLDANKIYVRSSDQKGWEILPVSSCDTNKSFSGAGSIDKLQSSTSLTSGTDSTFSVEYSGDMAQYRNDRGDITIGFFTTVYGQPGVYGSGALDYFTCDAELVANTGDISQFTWNRDDIHTSAGKAKQYPIRITASAQADIPQLRKDGEIDESNADKTVIKWKVTPTLTPTLKHAPSQTLDGSPVSGPPDGSIRYGGYNGSLRIFDSMDSATTKDISGTTLSIKPGQYTHITQMFIAGIHIKESLVDESRSTLPYVDASGKVTGYLGWQRWENGTWKSAIVSDKPFTVRTLWSPTKAGIYRIVLSEESPNSRDDPLAVYIYYAGNMADSIWEKVGREQLSAVGANTQDSGFDQSLVVEYRGLKNAATTGSYIISPITYTTETDNRALLNALNEAAGKTGDDAQTALYDLSLSNSASCNMWWDCNKKPVSTTVEKRLSAMMSIQKTAHTIAKEIGDDAYTGQYTLSVVNGLTPTNHIKVEDFITKLVNAKATSGETIIPIENGTFEEEAALQELRSCLELKDLTITANIGQRKGVPVYQKGAFVSGWDKNSTLTLSTAKDYSSDKPGSLFQVKLQRNDGQIEAGAEFIISYGTALNMDTFRKSDYYLGEGLQIFNNAAASRTYTPLASTQSQIAAQAAQTATVDGDEGDLTLTVDCGGSVGSLYLVRPKMVKERTSPSGAEIAKWLYYIYTGTMGKGTVHVTSDDSLRYEIGNDTTFTDQETNLKVALKDLPKDEQTRIKTVLEHLVERHTTYSNIKVYYTDTRPTSNGSNLSDSDLLWDLGSFAVTGGTKVTGGKATAEGLKDLQLGTTPSGEKKSWTGSGKYDGIKLTLRTSPAVLWQMENGELGHSHLGFSIESDGLDNQKYLAVTYDTTVDWAAVYADAQRIFGSYQSSGKFVNEAGNDYGEKDDSQGSTVTIEDASLKKSLTGSNAAAGTANWQLVAKTGSRQESELTLSDTLEITLPDGAEERVKTAAEAATSIDPTSVKITLRSGSQTETIYENRSSANGWEDNIAVTVEGRHLEVTVKNGEGSEKLHPDQTYTVTYSSKLDRSKFLESGGKTQDAYTLQNTAVLDYGNLNLTDTASGSFRPDLPITAKKTCESSGNVIRWTATGTTGDYDRENFTLRDSLSAADEKLIAAMMLQSMEITVKTGDQEMTYTLDTLPESTVLTALDGSALTLEKLGFEGFKLCFDKLSANTTVTVHYVTAVDRETYGKDGTFTVKNMLEAASADGAKASSSASGRVEVKKPFEKAGSEPYTTEDGRTMLRWTMNLNLSEKFSQSELEKMAEATIRDNLSPVLRLDMSSVTVKDMAGNPVDFKAEQIGPILFVHLRNPGQHPSVVLSFETECLAEVDNLVNQAELSIDGLFVDQAKSPEIAKVPVNGQYGLIQSVKAPVFAPEAWKYEDHILCTEDGKYSFTITEVNADGVALDYTETVSNNGDGKIPFSEIKYAGAGTHYYQMKETGEEPLDTRVFTLRVDVEKVTGGYMVSSVLLSPENYAEVRFDNTTDFKTTDFTVTKVWEDNDNEAGLRPDGIVVRLYQGSEPYNNMTVTLNESNNWTYTWSDLPVAGGAYRAVEEPVPGYDSVAVTRDHETVLTNTVCSGQLTIEKTVAGSNSNVNQDFVFTVTLTDANGTVLGQRFRYTGSKTGTITSGEQITLKHGQSITIENLPAGTHYEVTETPAEGYDTTVTNGSGVIQAGEHQTAGFLNRNGGDISGTGKLTLTKSVTGKGGDRSMQFTFTVALTDSEGRPLVGSYPYSGSKTGMIQNGDSIQLKSGESITITELPDGAQYQVEELEANQNGYTTSASGAIGTVEKDGAAEVSFVNHKPGDSDDDKPVSGKTSLTVQKKWVDNGSHPAYVLVQLMRNGKAYSDPIRLQDENGWQYTWTNLNRDDQWSVQEVQVPESYQVSVSYEGTVWTITNTKSDTPNQPDQPSQPDKPSTPDQPSTPDVPDQPNQPETPNIPVTPDTPVVPDKPTTPDRTPKTGDETHLTFWFALMGTSLLGLILSAWEVRKSKREKHIR